jgi:hypothetical protein
MRQNNILKHALSKNKELLQRLKSLSPEELRLEIMGNQHHSDYILDPSGINKLDEEANVNIDNSVERTEINTTKDENLQSHLDANNKPVLGNNHQLKDFLFFDILSIHNILKI